MESLLSYLLECHTLKLDLEQQFVKFHLYFNIKKINITCMYWIADTATWTSMLINY